MKIVTLNDVIQQEKQDPEFTAHFQREMLINEIAKLVMQLGKYVSLMQREPTQKAG